MATGTQDKITLYTNHRCPWAHRAHIILSELNIPFEEVTIDLDRPRDPWYLEVNPRGLVPSLKFNDEIITESGVVVQFLADQYPSHLIPASNEPGAALKRARIAWFVDTLMSKGQSIIFKLFSTQTEAESEEISTKFVDNIVKEVEPLLSDAKPFFGGSEKLTLVEVLTGSFIIRLLALSKSNVYPASLATGLKEKAPNFYKWAEAVSAHTSVNNIFDEQQIVEGAKSRLAKARGQL